MSSVPPPALWGPSFWRFLHYFAMNTPDRAFIKQLKNCIPCEECRAEWRDPTDTEDLVTWSKNLHNHVNAKLGRYANWDLTDFNIAHKNTCDACLHQEYVFMFPWTFIHTIASSSPEALQFLKTFDQTFPCITCRTTFFTDDPAEDETLKDWADRHHNRWNLARGLPPYVPPPLASSRDTTGSTASTSSSAPCEGC